MCGVRTLKISQSAQACYLCQSSCSYIVAVACRSMRRSHLLPDTFTLNTVVTAAACNQHIAPAEVDAVLEHFAQLGVHRNIYICCALLQFCRTTRKLDYRDKVKRMEAHLRDMFRFGVRPTAECMNIVINTHWEHGDHKGARLAFDRLVNAGVRPNRYSYATMCNVCTDEGRGDLVRHYEQQKRFAEKIGLPLDSRWHARHPARAVMQLQDGANASEDEYLSASSEDESSEEESSDAEFSDDFS